ncbi:MAG: PAS domain S-box protein, partial [Cyclobacteriaceae bacterium]|nr:PAS domain S-box protein [Cyclobacteriaceae bacterium]
MKDRTKPNFVNKSDITELTQLKESEERFRNTFEQAAVGIAHVRLDGNFIRINQEFCDIVGYSQQEMLKLTFQDITHPDDLTTDLNNVQRLLDQDIDNYTMEKRYFRKNKTIVWINLTVSLVRNETGDPKYFIAVVEDITERKQAEDKFELLVEQAGDAFFILDYDDAIIDVNHQACLSLGYSRKELLKMKISQVDIEVVDKQHKSRFWDSLNTGQYITFEGVHQRKDGSTFPVEVRLGRMDLKEKRLLLALARDITDRKRKEKELKKNAEFKQLVSRISTKFTGLSGVEFEHAIQDNLAEIGRYFGVDTVRLYQLSQQGEVLKFR